MKLTLLPLFLALFFAGPIKANCEQSLNQTAQLFLRLDNKIDLAKTYAQDQFVSLAQDELHRARSDQRLIEPYLDGDSSCPQYAYLKQQLDKKRIEIIFLEKRLNQIEERRTCQIHLERMKATYSQGIDFYEEKKKLPAQMKFHEVTALAEHFKLSGVKDCEEQEREQLETMANYSLQVLNQNI